MQVKLINLNTWHGGRYTWDNIVSYIKQEQPDIITLQEVRDSHEPGAPFYLNSYQSLQQTLGYPYTEYEPSVNLLRDGARAPSGNAIFSKFPLANKNILWLQGDRPNEIDDSQPETFPNVNRNLLHCQAAIGDLAYNLMSLQGVWAHDATETENQKKMGEKLSAYIQGMDNIIMAGDFNVNENTQTIRLLEKDLVNIFKGERTTSFNMAHKANPGYATAVVDFVFASKNITVVEHYTSQEDISDHQSQVVIFEL